MSNLKISISLIFIFPETARAPSIFSEANPVFLKKPGGSDAQPEHLQKIFSRYGHNSLLAIKK